MNTFKIHTPTEPTESPFDRQQRISWWSQERLSRAKVMVVGAGAIGNETLKNLALLGIGNIFIVDFDTISTSNLSRTVLFRTNDVGRRKAEVAAKRTRELALMDDTRIDWMHGDVVWDLGTGVFSRMDIILGCLDNVETRFAVNRRCWLTTKPWIDAGISELAASVTVYVPPESPCYQCGASKEQKAAQRRRYSCDDFKRAHYAEGKVPTVQVASAIVSAIQVQEAVKLLCGQEVAVGKKIYYQGKCNDFDVLSNKRDNACSAHSSYPEVVRLSFSVDSTLREFLQRVSNPEFSGGDATLDFRGEGITFVASAGCRSCGTPIAFYRPAFRILDTEVYCNACSGLGRSTDSATPAQKVTIGQFNLRSTEARVLDMSLSALGIPPLHVLAVYDTSEIYTYYELSSDEARILPNISRQ